MSCNGIRYRDRTYHGQIAGVYTAFALGIGFFVKRKC